MGGRRVHGVGGAWVTYGWVGDGDGGRVMVMSGEVGDGDYGYGVMLVYVWSA